MTEREQELEQRIDDLLEEKAAADADYTRIRELRMHEDARLRARLREMETANLMLRAKLGAFVRLVDHILDEGRVSATTRTWAGVAMDTAKTILSALPEIDRGA